MKHRITSRTRARKRAVDTIFEADQRGELSPDGIRELLAARKQVTAAQTPLPEYAIEIVEGIAERIYQIDDLLVLHTTTRDFDRLPSADRAILRVGAWEIVWNNDVPPVTAIDEAVTIAKEISTDDSPGVVNGILDAVRKDAARVRQTDEAFAAALAPRDEESDEPDETGEALDDSSEQLNIS
ncbi:MAG: transcription antitermination factor NusB [Actinomycetaceae bacterium]|nr:transcription antitermination factor NusB [Actinomycetaceae bacterium]